MPLAMAATSDHIQPSAQYNFLRKQPVRVCATECHSHVATYCSQTN